jgi:hypothetical protein
MNNEFTNVFNKNKRFNNFEEARRFANEEFGKRHNIVFVTLTSSVKRNVLILKCKHHGDIRTDGRPINDVANNVNELGNTSNADQEAKETENIKKEEEEETSQPKVRTLYRKYSYRIGCPCFIRFGGIKGEQGIFIKEANGKHNHPIPELRTVYALHRKQDNNLMKLIYEQLSINNSVNTIMVVGHFALKITTKLENNNHASINY